MCLVESSTYLTHGSVWCTKFLSEKFLLVTGLFVRYGAIDHGLRKHGDIDIHQCSVLQPEIGLFWSFLLRFFWRISCGLDNQGRCCRPHAYTYHVSCGSDEIVGARPSHFRPKVTVFFSQCSICFPGMKGCRSEARSEARKKAIFENKVEVNRLIHCSPRKPLDCPLMF